MIFVDSNIPMYLVGSEHPNKKRARVLLQRLIEAREKLVADVEVFQELLHRYTAIQRREAIAPAWRALEDLVDEILPIEFGHVERARKLLFEHPAISSRDALHLAVMEARGVERILSFDRGFDSHPSARRVF